MNEKQQVLNLTNICDGKLEAEFEEMYKDALRKISKGQKAKITINIEMLRVPDTDTIVELGYNINNITSYLTSCYRVLCGRLYSKS